MSTENTTAKAVDLGLSVKWASCNIKSAKDSSKDAFFAWGCTEEQSVYIASTYPYYQQDITDNTGYLRLNKDAAVKNWGDKWRMPSAEEWEELITKCTWVKTTQDGVEGYNVSGNGNTIFIPMSGMFYGDELYHENYSSLYWTSKCSTVESDKFVYAYAAYVKTYSTPFYSVSDKAERCIGGLIRPIYDESLPSTTPDTDDDTDTGIVDTNAVDLGLSVKWARWNIGAYSEDEYGSLIAWGDPTGKNTSFVNSDYPNPSSGDIAGTKYDTATALWGEGWRMPTPDEWNELDSLTKELITLNNGIKVFKVTAANGNYIYLPRGGYETKNGLQEQNVSADYWTSQCMSQTWATGVRIGKVSSTFEYQDQKGWHMLIRPIYEKKGSSGNTDSTLTDEGKKAMAVDLGLSVKWATYNLGASGSTDPGSYFSWAETSPKANFSNFSDVNFTKNNYKWYDASTGKFNIPGTNISYKTNDAATQLWGGTWRMPTQAEMQELAWNCTWIKEDYGFRVKGPNGNEIFLPTTGFFQGIVLTSTDKCYYWSASYNDLPLHAEDYWAYYLTNYTSGSETMPTVISTYVYNGLCIRPVSGGDVTPSNPDTPDDSDSSDESREKLINEYPIIFKSCHYKKQVIDFTEPWNLFNTKSKMEFLANKNNRTFLDTYANFKNTTFNGDFSINYWKGDTYFDWSSYINSLYLRFEAGAGFIVKSNVSNGDFISAIDFSAGYSQIDRIHNVGIASSAGKTLWVAGSYAQPEVDFYYRNPGLGDVNALVKTTVYGFNLDEVPSPGSSFDYGTYTEIEAKGYKEAMFNFTRPHTLDLFTNVPDSELSYYNLQNTTFKKDVVSVSFNTNPNDSIENKNDTQLIPGEDNLYYKKAKVPRYSALTGNGSMFTISVEEGYYIKCIAFLDGLGWGHTLLVNGEKIYHVNERINDSSLPIYPTDQDGVIWQASEEALTSVSFASVNEPDASNDIWAIAVGYIKKGSTPIPPTPVIPDTEDGGKDINGNDPTPTPDNNKDNDNISSDALTLTDTYSEGYSIDPNVILFAGGQEVIPQTMAQKDNTLFLGNFKESNKVFDQNTLDFIKANSVVEYIQSSTSISKGESGSLYMYENQLGKSSYDITFFKGGEAYRFGLVFQDIRGEWSDVVYVGDKVNDKYPSDSGTSFKAAKAHIQVNSSVVTKLYNMGYRKAKAVVVYPSINNRLVVCQGVMCPTVYNINQRKNNSPYAMSSWFFREMHSKSSMGTQNMHNCNIYNDIIDYVQKGDRVLTKTPTVYFGGPYNYSNQFHSITQFRAELSCADVVSTYAWRSIDNQNMYVDWNTVTMNTPEVDFSLQDSASTIPTENVKLRIIGVIPLTSNANDIYVYTDTQPIKVAAFTGLHNSNDNHNNISSSSMLRLTQFDWYDYDYHQHKEDNDWNVDKQYFENNDDYTNEPIEGVNTSFEAKAYKAHRAYPLYPWQGAKSLVGQFKTNEDTGIIHSALKKKIISNIRTSAFTYYFPNKALNYSIGNVGIYSGDIPLTKLTSDANDTDHAGMFNYYGEVDTLIAPKEYYEIYQGPLLVYSLDKDNFVGFKDIAKVYPCGKTNDSVRMKYKSSPHLACHLNYTKDGKQELLPSFKLRGTTFGDQLLTDYSWDSTGKYYIPGWSDKVLDKTKNAEHKTDTSLYHQSSIDLSYIALPLFSSTDYAKMGYMYIGEFYKDTPTDLSTLFGGKTSMAFEQNQWHTAGPTVSLVKDSALTVDCLQGDTYYQRYDSMKTYPYSDDDPNQLIEILSFMCETRMNIDGRYDANRGMASNLYMNRVNFNLFNPAYTQQDNFFNYYFLAPEKNSDDTYPNGFLWTSTKTMGEEIDSWSKINTSSSYSLDGDKGNIYALVNWNDTLLSFQENGIARIMYNDRVQIATNDGSPIELANSGKVSGKQYMSNTIGCTNKRTIQITPKGLYFMDSNSKDLYVMGGNSIDSLSKSKGFNNYFYNKDINKFRTFYDEKSGDIYFIDDTDCLDYNESLNEFEGFYDYGGTDYMFNYGDSFMSVKNSSIWKQYAGDYNVFFNEYKPFWLTLISNDGNNDKTFSNIEFEADSWHKDNTLADTTFDHLSIWDEYQMGEASLRTLNVNAHYHFSNLKRKFRIWRANIPRELKLKNITFPDALKKMEIGDVDENTGKILNMTESLNRIRNTWAYIRLKKYKENTDKTILHGIKTIFIV